MAMRPCKGCKSPVDTTAKACPQCGRPNPAGGPYSVVHLFGCLLVLSALVGTCAFVVGGGSRKHAASGPARSSTSVGARARPAKPAKPAKPAVEIGAVKLWRAYDANEVAADAIYKGKTLRVTGRVASIDKDFLDNIVVRLRGPNSFASTIASVSKGQAAKAAALKKGQTITIDCVGGGRVIGSPSLNDCRFVAR